MNSLEKKIQILENINTSETITKLAAKLYLSQPYVSRLLKEMETEYGLTLVDRQDKPISLTNAGRIVLNDLRQIQNAQIQMNQNLANLQRISSHEITIVLNSSICEADIVDLTTDLIDHFPEIKFNFIINGIKPREVDLINKNIDILIGPKWNNQLFDIKFVELNQLALLIPPSCSLYQPGRLYCPFSENNLTVLNNINYVEANDNAYLQKRVNHFLADNCIRINKLATVSSIRLATKLAIREKATTITTDKIVQHALGERGDYNLMLFPKSALNLEVAISMRHDATEEVQVAYNYLYEQLRKLPLTEN